MVLVLVERANQPAPYFGRLKLIPTCAHGRRPPCDLARRALGPCACAHTGWLKPPIYNAPIKTKQNITPMIGMESLLGLLALSERLVVPAMSDREDVAPCPSTQSPPAVKRQSKHSLEQLAGAAAQEPALSPNPAGRAPAGGASKRQGGRQ